MLMTVKQYAEACEVTPTLIYKRIVNGDLVPVRELVKSKPTAKGYEILLIDTDKFPPSKVRLVRGRVGYGQNMTSF